MIDSNSKDHTVLCSSAHFPSQIFRAKSKLSPAADQCKIYLAHRARLSRWRLLSMSMSNSLAENLWHILYYSHPSAMYFYSRDLGIAGRIEVPWHSLNRCNTCYKQCDLISYSLDLVLISRACCDGLLILLSAASC